jgi:hypothetical protein
MMIIIIIIIMIINIFEESSLADFVLEDLCMSQISVRVKFRNLSVHNFWVFCA